MFVAMSYARMNRFAHGEVRRHAGRGLHGLSATSARAARTCPTSLRGTTASSWRTTRFSHSSRIGNNVTLWSGNHIGHDQRHRGSLLHHIARRGVGKRPNRSAAFIGVNATLRNSITIAPDTLIGAGAAIMKDTQPGEVYLPPKPTLHSKAERRGRFVTGRWRRLGALALDTRDAPWAVTHAALPVLDPIATDQWAIFFSLATVKTRVRGSAARR